MSEEITETKKKLTISQTVLLGVLYLVIIITIVLSISATKNLGQESFDSCVQHKCETRGEEDCTKYREVNNCCLGAGGRIAIVGNGYQCVFN